MIKSQFAISLAVLLLVSPDVTQARFLQSSTNQLSNIEAFIPHLSQASTITYNANLLCGECILGGYVYCTNGVEGFTGKTPQAGTCCQDSKNCTQISQKGWVCSSKYDNMTIPDKLRVCPYDNQQCGDQNLTFNELGDSQCLRLKSLKKGNACLYKVKSKCGMPTFKLNDTSANLYTSSVMISNKTITSSAVVTDKCNSVQSQDCICKEISANGTTKYVCDCQTAFNREIQTNNCTSCKKLTDGLGNIIQQCKCNLPVPIQTIEDQQCQCARLTNATTKATYLSCTCTPSTAALSLPENQCKCINNYNATTKKAFLDCTCKNITQCVDPAARIPAPPKAQVAPCKIAYPCSCNAISITAPQNLSGNSTANSTNYQCSCLNPSTGIKSLIPSVSANQCGCKININSNSSTWFQDCDCCLSEEIVRMQLIPPVQCGVNDWKESCQCINSTVTGSNAYRQTCNCTHPQSNILAPNLIFNNNGCDCENNSIGKKACSCCVPQEVLSTQLQPKCNQNLDTCRCLSAALKSSGVLSQVDSKLSCECDSGKFNKTFVQVSPSNSSCYCAPLAINQTQRACNCCLSDNLLNNLKCQVGKISNQCKCDVSNNPFTNICDCPNKFGYPSNMISSKIPISKDQCQCNNSTGITTCNCCTSDLDVLQPPFTCAGSDVKQQCSKCANVTINAAKKIFSFQCSCVGTHPADNSVVVIAPNTIVNLTKCNCNNQDASCNCCGNSSVFVTQKPTCTADQSPEKPQCLLKNVTETISRNVNYQVNQTTSVVCRRTGYNGDLCQRDVNMTVNAWNNAFACFTTAKAVCDFNLTTLTCGWIQSDALKACIAKPAAIASPTTYQNQTFTPNPAVTYTTTVNKTRTEVYQQTSTKFQCNFTTTRYPSSTFTNFNIGQAQCACAAPAVPPKAPKGTIASQACDCCIRKDALDTFFLSNYTCKVLGTAPTDCICVKSTGICQCNAPDGVSQYKDIKVDTKNNCACANQGDQSQCKCCLSSSVNSLIPSAPVCAFNTAATTGCICNPVNGTSVSKCSCPNNVVQTLPNNNCNCLLTVNGALRTSTCNCCTVTKPLSCPNTTYSDTQNCDCVNITVPAKNGTAASWFYNCTCLRRDNKAIGVLQISEKNACGLNTTTGANQCCITPAQFATELPVLNCQPSDKKQSCGCSNQTGNSTTRNCSCTRDDNGVLGSFRFPENSCLCTGPRVNTTLQNCNCCVSKTQQSLQIPRKNCDVEGPSFAPQVCSCKNSTASNSLSCTCQRSEFLIPKSFNLSSSYCLYQDNQTQYECCLNQEQRAQLIPSLQCATTDLSQTGCSCTNVTNNGGIDYTCSCPFTYQKTTYVASTLTSKSNGCMCNGTTCGCCLSASLIESSTQKICTVNQTRSVCQQCSLVVDAKTKKNTLSCQGCDTFPNQSTNIVIKGQQFTGLEESSCLCRNDTARTNCTCCQASASVALQPTAPTCAIGTNLVSNTVCNVASGNDTVIRCNLTSVDGLTETYYRNILQSDLASINCFTIANGTRVYQQCKSCAYQTKLAPPAPDCSSLNDASVEQCQCLAVKASNGSTRYNCDCNYKNLQTIKDLSLASNQCGCLETNTLSKPCGCCVTGMQFRTAPNPACGNDTQAICQATLTTVTDAKTKITTKILTGDCMAVVNSTTIVNRNMTLNQNQCVCFNDTNNTLACKCCMSGSQDIRRLPTRSCRADQVGGQCDCLGSNSSCRCTLNNGNYSFRFPDLTPNSSDCSCVTSTKGNNTDRSCSCCAPRTLITPNVTSCAANTTSQQCNCKNPVFGFSTCDCTRLNGKVLETRTGVALNTTSQCACVNQVFNGTTSQNCTCCVPPPPPTFCQTLAFPGQSLQGCACKDQVVNGKAVFSCNCAQKVGSVTASRSNLLYDEASQCCCNEVLNATTKVGTKICNCTLPVSKQEQGCSCKLGAFSGKLNCQCNDCFNQQTTLSLSNSLCSCSSTPVAATNTTAATSANCTCQVFSSGLCPSVDITKIPSVTEDTCRASNIDLLPTLPSASCTNEYEYIVAVVASNKDSSVLVTGQSLIVSKQLRGSSSFIDGILSYFYY